MAIIHFTEEEGRLVKLPSMQPNYNGDPHIHTEDASNCDGVGCGERMESALSAEDYEEWLETHAEKPPVGRHSHLVVHGENPETQPSIFAVFIAEHRSVRESLEVE